MKARSRKCAVQGLIFSFSPGVTLSIKEFAQKNKEGGNRLQETGGKPSARCTVEMACRSMPRLYEADGGQRSAKGNRAGVGLGWLARIPGVF
jgi:hypothetical protein